MCSLMGKCLAVFQKKLYFNPRCFFFVKNAKNMIFLKKNGFEWSFYQI